jgi:hypothetical protein
MTTFTEWLAATLNEREHEVDHLLADKVALHFLIAWSLLESKCFGGFMKPEKLAPFSVRLVREGFSVGVLSTCTSHFHQRYQSPSRLANLLHGHNTPAVFEQFRRCLAASEGSLSSDNQIFLVGFVAYRFRNNMFHGNKGVESWLQFRPQIGLCTTAMQSFITHAETVSPSMPVAAAA